MMTRKLLKSKTFGFGLLAAIATIPLLMSNLPAIAQMQQNTGTANSGSKKPMMSNQGTMNKPGTTHPNPTTHSQLRPNRASARTTTVSVLRMGSRGNSVNQLQTYLKQKGLYNGSINGMFDSRTRSAVIAFQRSHHLRSDGVVGPLTMAAMK